MNFKPYLLGVLLVLITISTSFGQQGHNISYRLLSPDYQYLTDRNNDVRYNGAFNMVTGVEIGYFKSLTDGIDLGIPFRHGNVLYPLSDTDVNQYREQSFTSLGISGRLRSDNGKLLPVDAFLSPYLLAGLEGNYYGREKAFEFNFPVGAGLNFRLVDGFNIQLQSEYHIGATNFLVHSAGFFMELGRGTSPEPTVEVTPIVEAPSDKDGDGVVDAQDDCPDVAGIAKFGGCPDTDGDGIKDSEDKCPKVAGIAKFGGCADTDGDGIQDSEDECPDVAGLAKFNGCADTDNDGVEDSKDECPKIAGLVSNNGCPNTDADGDGVEDSQDECPNVAGLAKFNGCPDTDGDGVPNAKDGCPSIAGTVNGCPDKDKDGVIDMNDKCPSTPGTVANNGCPVVKEEVKKVLEFATQGIKFNTGSNVIKTSSYTVLDNVAKAMNENPTYNLRISGYTDSQGREDSNLDLSKRRAQACYDYLVKKGVASTRMSHNGYGEANPVATNDTPEGRAQNRRVELDIYFPGN